MLTTANGEVRLVDDFSADLTVVAIRYFTNELVIVSTILRLWLFKSHFQSLRQILERDLGLRYCHIILYTCTPSHSHSHTVNLSSQNRTKLNSLEMSHCLQRLMMMTLVMMTWLLAALVMHLILKILEMEAFI